jgi:hypothetical protein
VPKICYIDKEFRSGSRDVIDWANGIIREYELQGFQLTLRQLYYQMVARDLVENTQRSYKRIGSILSDARLAGLVDWFSIEDRTRKLAGNPHWKNPKSIIESALHSYAIDKWVNQPFRVEVWIEKDALSGVISGVCQELDIDYFSCLGYTSASEMWRAGRRLRRYLHGGQVPVVIHLGDLDPSGVDMTRDIEDRLNMFAESAVNVDRIALNEDQIDKYNPPPNPTKLTDSRAGGYISVYGFDSWELDALEPKVMVDLIRQTVLSFRDDTCWQAALDKEATDKQALRDAMGMV